jgi:hypothetical protein
MTLSDENAQQIYIYIWLKEKQVVGVRSELNWL